MPKRYQVELPHDEDAILGTCDWNGEPHTHWNTCRNWHPIQKRKPFDWGLFVFVCFFYLAVIGFFTSTFTLLSILLGRK